MDTSCVKDAEIQRDGDVCRFADSPTVQVDFDGDRDECAETHPAKTYRPFDCTTFFGGQLFYGMKVEQASQLVVPGRDYCRLSAALLEMPAPK